MLTERGVIEELLARKLIDTSALVDGAITVTDSSRRNHNHRVTVTSGPSYFLKQGVEAERIATLTREAALYRAIHTREEARAVSALTPQFYDFDSDKALLILQHVADARTMWDLYTEKGGFRSDIASATGRALADVHSLKPSTDWGEAGAVAPRPWVL